MKNMFSIRSSSYDLCGNYILSLSKPKTSNSGLNFFSYQTNSNENKVYVMLCYNGVAFSIALLECTFSDLLGKTVLYIYCKQTYYSVCIEGEK